MTADSARRVTAPGVVARKGDGTPLVMVTAYDAPSARTVDAAGRRPDPGRRLGRDGRARVRRHAAGHDRRHGASRRRGRAHQTARLVVADLPWLSYHVSTAETVHNAARLVRAGAGAVKLEGGRKRLDSVRAILDAEIPVMGHIGLTPQSIHALGGFKVQGKELDAAKALADDACALAEAGCFAIVLECVPDAVARDHRSR